MGFERTKSQAGWKTLDTLETFLLYQRTGVMIFQAKVTHSGPRHLGSHPPLFPPFLCVPANLDFFLFLESIKLVAASGPLH